MEAATADVGVVRREVGVFVRAAACAASVSAVRNATEPCRVRPDRLRPPEVLLPGQIPAQLARWAGVRNTVMSAPHSASSMIAVRTETPGIVHTRLSTAVDRQPARGRTRHRELITVTV